MGILNSFDLRSFLRRHPYAVRFVGFLGILFVYVFATLLFREWFNPVESTLCGDIVVIPLCWLLYQSFEQDCGERTFSDSWPVLLVTTFSWFLLSGSQTLFTQLYPDPTIENYISVLSEHDSAVYVILTLFVAPVFEELLFRGVLFRIFAGRFNVFAGMMLSSVLFAAVHGTFSHLYLGFFLGLFCALAYIRSGTVWASVLVHSVYNFMSLCGPVFLSFSTQGEPIAQVFTSIVLMNLSLVIMITLLFRTTDFVSSSEHLSRKTFRKGSSRSRKAC